MNYGILPPITGENIYSAQNTYTYRFPEPHKEYLPLSLDAICQQYFQQLDAFQMQYGNTGPVTILVDVERRLFVPAVWERVVERPEVTSIVLYHSRMSDQGYVQTGRIGFIGLRTRNVGLPTKIEDMFVSVSGREILTNTTLKFLNASDNSSFAYPLPSGKWKIRKKGTLATENERIQTYETKKLKGTTTWPSTLNPLEPHEDYWPPFRAFEKKKFLEREIAIWRAKRHAFRMENELGSPLSRANTTTPIAYSRHTEDGPVAICCATLMAGGAERQAALTTIGSHQRGIPTAFVGHSPIAIETHHYAHMLTDTGVPIYNAGLRKFAGLQLADHSLDPTEVEISNEIEERCRGLRLGLADIVEQYYRIFVELQPRVVHCWLDYTNTVAGLAAAWAGVPKIILGCRNGSPFRLPSYHIFFRPLYELLLTDSRVQLAANSDFGAVDYSKWLSVKNKRIRTIHNGFNPEGTHMRTGDNSTLVRKENRSDPNKKIMILGVFRLYPEKDPLLFIGTAAKILQRSPDVTFCLLGSGDLDKLIRKKVKELGIGSNISFVETQRDVFAWMDKATLLLHTPLVEGLPNVLIEAQSRGLPLVTTAAGGAGEAILPGVTGRCVNSRDPKKLAQVVLNCLEDSTWMQDASINGPKFVESTFGLSTMVDKTLAMYGLVEEK